MEMLFDIYMESDPAKALTLAQGLMNTNPDDSWKSFATYAKSIVDADQYVERGEAGKALETLDLVKLPKWYDSEHHLLVLKRAQAFGASKQPQKAYDALLKAYATAPSDDIWPDLVSSGKELGKEVGQVDADVWTQQVKNSRPAVPFSLPTYSGDKPRSLADFTGRVILLNFWYPLCGPCRGEFPYIQAVLDKYKDQGFDIVAVNVEPEEDDFVLPLLKGFKLGFIPLKGSDEWASSAYEVRGEPTNFLIGADGRLYFGPLRPISSPEAERTLELQVEALLRARQVEKKSKLTGDHTPAAFVGVHH
jgi:thiol-disulfide isomerase/thioredoxin